MVKALRRERYDAAIDLRGDLRNVLLMWLAGIPIRLGQPGAGLTYLLTDRIDLPEPHHQVAECVELVKKLDVTQIDPWPHLPLRAEDLERADAWLRANGLRMDKPIVAMHLGASIAVRIWPLERFVAVARRLREQADAQFLIVGGKGEIEAATEFSKQAGAAVAIATGGVSLIESAALLARCSVFIGNDSGPAHLAAYAGTPVVSLFSSANPACTRPLSPSAIVLVPSHPCDPRCDKTCAIPERRCVLDHSVETVTASALKLLRSTSTTPATCP
jgi:lipopolysaccharide heptosyltransferase II